MFCKSLHLKFTRLLRSQGHLEKGNAIPLRAQPAASRETMNRLPQYLGCSVESAATKMLSHAPRTSCQQNLFSTSSSANDRLKSWKQHIIHRKQTLHDVVSLIRMRGLISTIDSSSLSPASSCLIIGLVRVGLTSISLNSSELTMPNLEPDFQRATAYYYFLL